MAILDVLTRWVRERSAHPFLRHEGRTVTYGDFDALVNRAAHGLLAAGVRKGDRVTLALGNSVEYAVVAFGVLRAGAVLNPVNPALGRGELEYVLGHAAPRLVVTDSESDATLRSLGQRTVRGDALGAGRPASPVPVRVEAGDFSTPTRRAPPGARRASCSRTVARARAARTSSRRWASRPTTRSWR
jgi:acyl-CoA synthetase (AMP-forming)/AMP-acid ligase II